MVPSLRGRDRYRQVVLLVRCALECLLFLYQPFLDIAQGLDGINGLLEVEPAGIVGVELGEGIAALVAFFEILVVIQATVVGGNTVEITHVDGFGTFLVGKQGFVHLFAVADANHFDVLFLAAKQLADGFRLGLDGAGGGFFDEEIAVFAMLEGEEHQIHRFFQRHDEPGHVGLGDGDGVAGFDLVDPQRDNGAPGAHNVAIPGAADFRLAGHAGLGNGHLFFNSLGHAHGVDGIGGLVGGQADNGLHTELNSGSEHVVGADDIGPHGLHGEELAGRHLLQSSGVENIVHPGHGSPNRL